MGVAEAQTLTIILTFVSFFSVIFVIWVGISIISINSNLKKFVDLEYQKYNEERSKNAENSVSNQSRSN